MNLGKINDPRFRKRWEKSGALGTITFDQQKHPEIGPDEVFITNADEGTFCIIGWATKRRGNVALDSLGRPLSQNAWHGAFPVFAQRSELAAVGVFITKEVKAVSFYPASY